MHTQSSMGKYFMYSATTFAISILNFSIFQIYPFSDYYYYSRFRSLQLCCNNNFVPTLTVLYFSFFIRHNVYKRVYTWCFRVFLNRIKYARRTHTYSLTRTHARVFVCCTFLDTHTYTYTPKRSRISQKSSRLPYRNHFYRIATVCISAISYLANGSVCRTAILCFVLILETNVAK